MHGLYIASWIILPYYHMKNLALNKYIVVKKIGKGRGGGGSLLGTLLVFPEIFGGGDFVPSPPFPSSKKLGHPLWFIFGCRLILLTIVLSRPENFLNAFSNISPSYDQYWALMFCKQATRDVRPSICEFTNGLKFFTLVLDRQTNTEKYIVSANRILINIITE